MLRNRPKKDGERKLIADGFCLGQEPLSQWSLPRKTGKKILLLDSFRSIMNSFTIQIDRSHLRDGLTFYQIECSPVSLIKREKKKGLLV